MHPVELPQDLIEQVGKRRGAPNPFADFAPARTALVVIDMQNFFLAPGTRVEVAAARDIVPNVNRLATVLRRLGGTVVWTQMSAEEADQRAWSVMYDRLCTPVGRSILLDSFSAGQPPHALWPDLAVEPGDVICRKRRFSAFVQGSSDLEQTLLERAIATLLIAGTTTDVCCESTARDAMMRNFEVIMVSDATAAHSDDLHLAALTAFYRTFGDVMQTDDVIACAERNAQARSAAL